LTKAVVQVDIQFIGILSGVRLGRSQLLLFHC